MHVERVISLNSGWSILTSQKQEEWEEVMAALNVIDDDSLLGWIHEGDKAAYIGYAYLSLNQFYNYVLKQEFDWHAVSPRNEINQDHYRTVPIKNGLLTSIAGLDDLLAFSLPKLLYITIPYHYQEGLVDVGVILVPTNELVKHILELGAKQDPRELIPTEEFCRAEATRFIALTSRTPVVLAFFSSTLPDNIAIEELSPPRVSAVAIERTIEFAPEYYQASVGLLSYFGEVLRQKDPNTKAKVRIEQEGNRVRLHIESPGGDIEIIEKELAQYALVISRQAAPETLLENRAHIMQLETQLDITRIQVKQAQDLMQLAEGQYTQRINNLEEQVKFLQTQFAAQILQSGQFINLVAKQNDSHERTQAALLTHSSIIFKDLLQEASGNQRLLDAINILSQTLFSGLTTLDVEEQIKQALETVKQTKPGMLARIYTQVEGAALKAGAGATLGWAADLVKHALPPH